MKLGDFGILKPSFSAASSTSSANANAGSIRRKKILFRPGKRLAQFIEDLPVTSMDSWDEETDEPTTEPEPGGGTQTGGGQGEGEGELS